jgi:hypothetical protein
MFLPPSGLSGGSPARSDLCAAARCQPSRSDHRRWPRDRKAWQRVNAPREDQPGAGDWPPPAACHDMAPHQECGWRAGAACLVSQSSGPATVSAVRASTSICAHPAAPRSSSAACGWRPRPPAARRPYGSLRRRPLSNARRPQQHGARTLRHRPSRALSSGRARRSPRSPGTHAPPLPARTARPVASVARVICGQKSERRELTLQRVPAAVAEPTRCRGRAVQGVRDERLEPFPWIPGPHQPRPRLGSLT